jgi:hypothetical protein
MVGEAFSGLFGLIPWGIPKLDVVGSNPIARSFL